MEAKTRRAFQETEETVIDKEGQKRTKRMGQTVNARSTAGGDGQFAAEVPSRSAR